MAPDTSQASSTPSAGRRSRIARLLGFPIAVSTNSNWFMPPLSQKLQHAVHITLRPLAECLSSQPLDTLLGPREILPDLEPVVEHVQHRPRPVERLAIGVAKHLRQLGLGVEIAAGCPHQIQPAIGEARL